MSKVEVIPQAIDELDFDNKQILIGLAVIGGLAAIWWFYLKPKSEAKA